MTLPKNHTAGYDFRAAVRADVYGAAGWALALHLRGPGTADMVGMRDAGEVVFTAPASVTSEWPAGRYTYAITAANGAEKREIQRGTIHIQPDIAAAAGGFDGRTETEIALEAIDAVLARRATVDQDRYRINNRELQRTPIGELLRLRNFYAEKLNAERRKAAGRPILGQVKFRM